MWVYNLGISRSTSNQPVSLPALLAGDVVQAAAGLIGCRLARRLPAGEVVLAEIVETEAYHQREPGCHAYRGQTPRNRVMFGPPGRLYVYFTYGMWHCANVVCEREGVAAAVLLRAAMPLTPREDQPPLRLSGPGLLCRGLQLTTEDNGADLLQDDGAVRLFRPEGWTPPPLHWTKRVGFSFADELEWRCCWQDHPALSKGRPGVVLMRKKKGAGK